MKIPIALLRNRQAFTLVEIMIVVGLMTMVGLGYLLFSSQALRSFTWLTATNIAHQNARVGIQNMLQDIHGSPSPLMLVNVRGQTPEPVDGTFQGVVFQRIIAGPLEITTNLTAGLNTIGLRTGNGFIPGIGQLIMLPNSATLYRITQVNALSGNIRTVRITPNIQPNDAMSVADAAKASASSAEGGGEMIVAYITQRSAYLVQPSLDNPENSELRFYPVVITSTGTPANGMLRGPGEGGAASDVHFFIPPTPGSNVNALNNPATFNVVSRGLRANEVDGVAMAPFSEPRNGDDGPNRSQVAAVQISLQDNNVSNLIAPDERGARVLNATTLFLNSNIPLRNRVTGRN